MQKELKNRIEELHRDYTNSSKIVDKENEEVKNLGSEEHIKSLAVEGKIDEAGEILIRAKVDNLLYNRELQIKFSKLIFLIEFYKTQATDLSEEVETFYEKNKRWMPKEVFVVKNDKLEEREKGLLEKERKEFQESEFFQNILKSLEQLEQK